MASDSTATRGAVTRIPAARRLAATSVHPSGLTAPTYQLSGITQDLDYVRNTSSSRDVLRRDVLARDGDNGRGAAQRRGRVADLKRLGFAGPQGRVVV